MEAGILYAMKGLRREGGRGAPCGEAWVGVRAAARYEGGRARKELNDAVGVAVVPLGGSPAPEGRTRECLSTLSPAARVDGSLATEADGVTNMTF
ncbi:hypothetical protein E2C01_077537 [Portunus trituberculatus]|uniref:Uncharacterized protein n=1 Tax=Portunus trituberculatus TaxID=210409 RepID=A0A5B7IBN6_PORTR|nr:hypothetical protein [Portunus trituberculatus]